MAKKTASDVTRAVFLLTERGRDLEEKEGFEPSIRYDRMPDFESGAFNHSATSPKDAKDTGSLPVTQHIEALSGEKNAAS